MSYMEKNMATEKNDNISEFCFPPELCCNDQNYQSGNTKSRQKLKDLLLSVNTKDKNNTNIGQHELSATSQSDPVLLNNSKFSSCIHENRNLTTTESSDFINSEVICNSASLNKHRLKDIKAPILDTKYGSYSFSNLGVIDSSLVSVIDSKHVTEDNNALEQQSSANSAPRKPSLVEKVITEDDRPQTPNIYDDADAYVFQDDSYDSTIATRFGTDDEWEMAINAENSPVSASMNAYNKPMSHPLLIKQQGTSDTLRQQISQVVGESNMTVLSLEECFDVNSKADVYSHIWLQILSPLSKCATEVITLLRSNNNKNVVVVSDKTIKGDLPIPTDIFVEPLTKETVEKLLCSNLKECNSQSVENFCAKQNMSTRNVSSTPESTISSASGRTSNGSPLRNHSPPRWCRVEHATKEKQRRERIKDSCDQLRVLLPYVKGRKTDMASILEMTVDYLKIVNSSLSQDFHTQVIDIMSNGSPPISEDFLGMNMAYKKNIRKDQDILDISPLEKRFHSTLNKTNPKATKPCKEGNLNKRMVTRSLSRTLSSSAADEIQVPNSVNSNKSRGVYGNINNGIIVTKRECSSTKTGSSNPKKPNITFSSLNNKKSRGYEASTSSLAVKEYKTENIMDDMPPQSHPYHNFQFPHMFTEGDISANRMFSSGHVSSNDGFAYVSHSQINLQSTHNVGDRTDMNNYGNVYFDGTYIPYSYSNLQDSTNGNYYGTEYVNPNAVLPVTSYTPRVSAFATGRKFERPSTSTSEILQGDSADVYNNNTVP